MYAKQPWPGLGAHQLGADFAAGECGCTAVVRRALPAKCSGCVWKARVEAEALAGKRLHSLGVRISIGDFHMGYFLSGPLTSEDVSTLLRERVPAPGLD
ncbi:hypothetical protein [Cupriavidus basilensis]|uniref:hypothetical protein n=1 Tax=Cupriavidus basilensis TaxID=68895 RepID=UPI0039F68CDF